MRDHLVCYLLGELSDSERVALEAKLAAEPRLRDELERLRQCMYPAEPHACGSEAPPRSLLDRTVKCVSDSQAGDEESQRSLAEPPPGNCSYSLVDAIVAVGVVFAISMLLLPALRESRDISRRNACQNNLRQLGFAFIHYADDNQGVFPLAKQDENAGIFAYKLANRNYLDLQHLTHYLICPSSAEAEAISNGTLVLRIPTSQQVATGLATLPPQVRAMMGGSLACRVGYLDGRTYISIYNKASCRSPLLSDAPSRENLAASSPHHGGCGQNVLFEDGHIAYVVGHYIPAWENHMFLNNEEQPAAGTDSNDLVMVRSEVFPAIRIMPSDNRQ